MANGNGRKDIYIIIAIIVGVLTIGGALTGFAVRQNNVKHKAEDANTRSIKNETAIKESDIGVIKMEIENGKKAIQEMKDDNKEHNKKTEQKFDKIIEEIQNIKQSKF